MLAGLEIEGQEIRCALLKMCKGDYIFPSVDHKLAKKM
jgi:hypothetical protein